MSKGYEMSQSLKFGEWLSRMRNRQGVTQGALADALGTKQSVISRIENGLKRSITNEEARIIAKTLNVSLSEVLAAAGLDVPSSGSLYVTDTSGRRWRILHGAGGLTPEVAEALGALRVMEIANDYSADADASDSDSSAS